MKFNLYTIDSEKIFCVQDNITGKELDKYIEDLLSVNYNFMELEQMEKLNLIHPIVNKIYSWERIED